MGDGKAAALAVWELVPAALAIWELVPAALAVWELVPAASELDSDGVGEGVAVSEGPRPPGVAEGEPRRRLDGRHGRAMPESAEVGTRL